MELLRRAVCVLAIAGAASCKRETPVQLYVDGFEPADVRFEIEDLGPLTDAAFAELKRRPDIDGNQPLAPGSCPTSCKAAIVTVFMHNKSGQTQAPPVVRLTSPVGKPRRLPIGFRGKQLPPGRIGRIRWLVQMWPDETDLVATLSSSVFVVNDPTAPKAAPTAPLAPPPATTPTPPIQGTP